MQQAASVLPPWQSPFLQAGLSARARPQHQVFHGFASMPSPAPPHARKRQPKKGHGIHVPGVFELKAMLAARRRPGAEAGPPDIDQWYHIVQEQRAKFQAKQAPFDVRPSNLEWPAEIPNTVEEAREALVADTAGPAHTISHWLFALVGLGSCVGRFQHAESEKRKVLRTLLDAHVELLQEALDTEAIIDKLLSLEHTKLALHSLEQLRMLLPRILASYTNEPDLGADKWMAFAQQLAPPGSGLGKVFLERPEEVRGVIVAGMRSRRSAIHKPPRPAASVRTGAPQAAQASMGLRTVSMSGADWAAAS